MIEIANETVMAARRGDQDAARDLVDMLHRPVNVRVLLPDGREATGAGTTRRPIQVNIDG